MATAGMCPQCGQLDAVRKVRSIVTEGVSVGYYESVAPFQWQGKTYYLPAQRETKSSTLLAQRLAPPVKPEFRRPTLIITIWAVVNAVVILAFVVPVSDLLLERIGFIAAPIPIILVLLIFALSIVPLKLYARPRVKEYNAAFARWKRAIERWEQLYYCARCDGVFLEDSRLVPVERMLSFLYE